MLANVYLGYEDGVARACAYSGPRIFGNIVSEHVQGHHELWPYDFPISAKAGSPVRPLKKLWRPQLSIFLHTEFAITGVERVRVGGGSR